MANTGFSGIDVRQTSGGVLVFRASLKDSTGARVTTGSANYTLYEIQSDGSFKSYDFSSNTFKTTALTTETLAATHQTGNAGATTTGIWTATLATLTGFTKGGIYLAVISHSSAVPAQQEREFQFGGAQGDLSVTAANNLGVDALAINGVSTSPVTTVNANVGTTQPINFAGTGASALVKGDLTAAEVATAVFTDLLSGTDFATANSFGALVKLALPDAAPATNGGLPTVDASNNVHGLQTGVTVAANNDKTGYTLTQAFPANFANLVINSEGTVLANVFHTGTAQGGTSTSITLDAGATVTTDIAGSWIAILAGTGRGQTAKITGYSTVTKIADISGSWNTTPDATSQFAIVPASQVDSNLKSILGVALGQPFPGQSLASGFQSFFSPSAGVYARISQAVYTDPLLVNYDAAGTPGELLNQLGTLLQLNGAGPTFQFTAGALANVPAPASGVVLAASQPLYAPAVVGDPMTLTAAEEAAVADTTLRRTMAHVEASAAGDPVSAGSLYGLVQRSEHADTTTHAGKLTIFQTNGSELAQKTIAASAGAEPITGVS